MKVKDLATVVGIGLVLFVGYQRQKTSKAKQAAEAAARVITVAADAPDTVTPIAVAVTPGAPVEARDDAAIRSKIEEGAKGTYIKEMLAADPMLMRWPERRTNALRVWIEPSSTVQNWNPQYPIVAERVFGQWSDAGFPMSFEFQPDSAGASIKIRWATKLVEGGREIGLTRKTRDQNGWIVRADIEIATFDGRGNALSAETVGGVARHEVGHALGLGHSTNPNDVMYPESTTPIISAADRATLHLLYTLPPGVVK